MALVLSAGAIDKFSSCMMHGLKTSHQCFSLPCSAWLAVSSVGLSESVSASDECDCLLHYIKFTVDGWVANGQAISWSHRTVVNTAVS